MNFSETAVTGGTISSTGTTRGYVWTRKCGQMENKEKGNDK